MNAFWERKLPLIISVFILVTLLIINLLFKVGAPCSVKNFEKILDSTITFSSIVEGFIGVLLGIFISIKETKTVKIIFKHVDKKLMMVYLKEALFFGFFTIILSTLLYIECVGSNLMSYCWVFSSAYFLLASIRITMIMFQIIEIDEDDIYDSSSGFTPPPEEIEDAKKRLSN